MVAEQDWVSKWTSGRMTRNDTKTIKVIFPLTVNPVLGCVLPELILTCVYPFVQHTSMLPASAFKGHDCTWALGLQKLVYVIFGPKLHCVCEFSDYFMGPNQIWVPVGLIIGFLVVFWYAYVATP